MVEFIAAVLFVGVVVWGVDHFRQPMVQLDVYPSEPISGSVYEALAKHQMFVTLCMRHNVDVVATEGSRLTVRGRRRRMERFAAEHARLRALGAI